MTIDGGKGNGSALRLLIGAMTLIAVSGCSSTPTRPPMPDMTNLVPINDRVPTELQRSYIVERYESKPLELNLNASRFAFNEPALPLVDMTAINNLPPPTPKAPQYGPALALYDALEAKPVARVVASPARLERSVQSLTLTRSSLSASAEETKAPVARSAGRFEWQTPGNSGGENKQTDDVVAAAPEQTPSPTVERAAPPKVNTSPSLALAARVQASQIRETALAAQVEPAPVEQLEPMTVTAPSLASTSVEPTWTVERGRFRPQALRWGEKDPLWTVNWLASDDPIISIDHYEFTGPLDEVLIEAVSSLAAAGAPIRIERARANHQLIIRSRE